MSSVKRQIRQVVNDLPVSVKLVGFEVELSFDATAESCVHGAVELLENFECQVVVQQFHLHKLVKSLLESVSQSCVAVQLVRHPSPKDTE